MNTRRLVAAPLLSEEDLGLVVDVLSHDGVVALPTETVYGLAASLFSEKGVDEIFRAKGRASDNPLIAHVSDLGQVEWIAEEIPPSFFALAERFWPGALTLVVKRSPVVPAVVAANLSTVAIRMPVHPCARQIIEAVRVPLAAPSANRSGAPSATSAQDVLDDFWGTIPIVVDGGESLLGIESTVVGLFGAHPVLLRPGAIPREAVEEVLGTILHRPEGAARSPGMKYLHYAPKAKVVLVDEEEPVLDAYIPDDLSEKNLYAHLRTADRCGASSIAIRLTQGIRANEALMDRLLRASGHIPSSQCD